MALQLRDILWKIGFFISSTLEGELGQVIRMSTCFIIRLYPLDGALETNLEILEWVKFFISEGL